ncbi:PDZ/DHR/GLGF domain protein [Thermocrinis albus DSM 14484]|uniref:PDZ/DHR/GLGF domain protein n=1 Tax=Thermocrinis albus (strain DSM 14484 / JCM 11386 / HI 11/12) TaxID=638303 RepID=D3SMB0_THEAH|nr:PDZ domain-containing protein [Thermocrinis albus]ADC89890.1 PDZ/DHR/GLGF domain protein [Thermocrinis albus DSM 14484]
MIGVSFAVGLGLLLGSFILLYFTHLPNLKPPLLPQEKPPIPQIKAFAPVSSPQAEDIHLLGTATGSVRMALLQVGGEAKVVYVGSSVGPYKVEEIGRYYVILAKGDVRRKLTFETTQTTPTFQDEGSLQAVVSREELNRITADPGIMFRQIRLVPFLQGNKTKGFLIEWVDPSSIFSRMGLKGGDVLLAINNQEIRSGEDAFKILQVLRNESTIKLDLLREGKLITMVLRVE